jgi:hypothetical protein
VIWPWDTARGFRDIGYNPLIAGLAPFFIHTGMSLPTQVRFTLKVSSVVWLLPFFIRCDTGMSLPTQVCTSAQIPFAVIAAC